MSESGREYLVGEGAGKYSIADIASFCWASYAPYLKIDLSEFPAVKKWCDAISAREAVKRGKAVPDGAKTADELKEMFDGMYQKIESMTNEDKH